MLLLRYANPLLALILFASFSESPPALKFKSRHHHFGFVRQGQILECDYLFTNTGSTPLVIQAAETECSCTHADFPTVAVEPGEEGKIHLRFDSGKAIGRQERTIRVFSNATDTPQTLVFKCIILKKKE
jgi:hypothetical protein